MQQGDIQHRTFMPTLRSDATQDRDVRRFHLCIGGAGTIRDRRDHQLDKRPVISDSRGQRPIRSHKASIAAVAHLTVKRLDLIDQRIMVAAVTVTSLEILSCVSEDVFFAGSRRSISSGLRFRLWSM
jgi:hypothetical protein